METFETELLNERCDDLKVANEVLTEQNDHLRGVTQHATRLIASLLHKMENGESVEDTILLMHQFLAKV
jgi:hypothetical protein